MVRLPEPELARRRMSGLYQSNIAQLGERDVIVASCGGAGQSLVGNVLFQLGLNYVDGYTEKLGPDGSAVAANGHTGFRGRLASLHDRDAGVGGEPRLWPRFVKTHHPPEMFGEQGIGGVWLLVRDPRDALYSLYRWRRSFAEEPWDRVPNTFEEWLRGSGDYTESPVLDWSAFYVSWLRYVQGCKATVTRFEDLKTRPAETLRDALDELSVIVDAAELRQAVEASTFEKMRAHEDVIAARDGYGAAGARIMHSGLVNEWRRWWTPTLADLFDNDELWMTALDFGYQRPTGPASQK